MRGMRATEEEVEVGVVEGGITPGGEEEVTIDEVLFISEMLKEFPKVFPAPSQLGDSKERRDTES